MPYGLPKEVGGDNPSNDKWMEGCVNKVMKQKGKDGKTYDKSRAIAICKSTMMKTKGDKAKAEFIISSILMGKINSAPENN